MDRSHTVTHSSKAGLTPYVRSGATRPAITVAIWRSCGNPTRRLAAELGLSLAASSIMALMVIVGGEMLARIPPNMATTPTDPDPERTRVATDALSLRLLEANAPGSVTLPCWLSDGPNDIVQPCRR
jgi:hypothetical protein